MPSNRFTIPEIRARKGQEPLVVLTAYTTPLARLLDPHVDILLVGDSLGMVVYGMESTHGVTLEMMIEHTKAVMRGSSKACVISDMPFGSYQESPQQAFRNAARLINETACAGVKLEGGVEMAETVRFLAERGIPVWAHVGLMPQHKHAYGGFKVQGKGKDQAEAILRDAVAVSDAGAFALLIEGVPEQLGRQITETVTIPTVGIGASPHCDGQVLVTEDILGLVTDYSPKFVKR
ncbi:MAG: 3-methyl-2-oxobutanoate hydroxymethyltransferase, partial [Alphaproteobacteria bacterium]|nr:3-methyl-2-oxobutanoate hydroxymethyltransferase [Alphaproteobacteria bacterium]